MRKLQKEILFLKKGEQRALLLVSIFFTVTLFMRIFLVHTPEKEIVLSEDFFWKLDSLKTELDSIKRSSKSRKIYPEKDAPKLMPHHFDPNTAERDELESMGLPDRIISNLMNYRGVGGHFSSPEDLKKIYNMDALTFNALRDCIRIELAEPDLSTDMHGQKVDFKEIQMKIELNTADSAQLMKIIGVGPVYSSRIIKYRNILGGFYSMNQLWEIYGMDSIKYLSLSESSYIDTSYINTIDLNETTFKELVRHPYLTRQNVSEIVHYRDFAMEFEEVDDLKHMEILDSLDFSRIRPYLFCGIKKY